MVIISSDPAECARLRGQLPPGVVVHLAATGVEAVSVLQTRIDAASPHPPPQVHLRPDGVLVAGALVRLTPLEHAMLQCLSTPVGSVCSLLSLSQQVWGTSFIGNGSQVRAVLKRLRRKLLVAGADLQIESVRGRGLRLVVGTQGTPTLAAAPPGVPTLAAAPPGVPSLAAAPPGVPSLAGGPQGAPAHAIGLPPAAPVQNCPTTAPLRP